MKVYSILMKGWFCLTKHMSLINSINKNRPAFKLSMKCDKPRAGFSAKLQAPLQPSAGLPKKAQLL